MPSYITYTTLENITGSGLGQTILEDLIDMAEADVGLWLTELGGTADTSSTALKNAVKLLSISYLMTRMRMDGTKPASLNLGDIAMSDNIDAAKAELEAKARRTVESYCNGDTYDGSDVDPEATVVRQDHEMGQFQLDQSKVPAYHDKADDYALNDGTEVT